MAKDQALLRSKTAGNGQEEVVKGIAGKERDEATRYLESVSAIVVNTPEQMVDAENARRVAKSRAKDIEALRLEWTGPLNTMVKKFNGFFKPIIGLYERAEGILAGKILRCKNELDRQAEEARKKLEARAERKAERLEGKGDLEAADAVRATVPHVESAAPEIAGTYTVKLYRAEVTDLEVLAYFAVQSKKLNLIQANEKVINDLARGMQEMFDIPGCRLVITEDLRSRG